MNGSIFDRQHMILDGAMGTMLQAHGLPVGVAPDSWNIDNPEAVRAVHTAYAKAGADMILTNTFGCNGIRQRRSVHSVDALARAAVANARAAAPDVLVALDLGPLGAFLEPLGDISFNEAVALFSEPVLAATDADCILIETMIDLAEAMAAVTAAKRFGGGKPVFCTFSFNEKGRLLSGADVAEVCKAMEKAGVDAIGCNCGMGPEQLIPLMPMFTAHTTLPLIMKPNAGLPTVQNGTAVYDMTPGRFADAMRHLRDAGVWALGGCCGTSPEHIETLFKLLS